MKKIFSVFDKRSGFFFSPMTLNSVPEAVRVFGDIVADESSIIYRHPEDFDLFTLGDFDESTGSIESVTSFICSAKEISDASSSSS